VFPELLLGRGALFVWRLRFPPISLGNPIMIQIVSLFSNLWRSSYARLKNSDRDNPKMRRCGNGKRFFGALGRHGVPPPREPPPPVATVTGLGEGGSSVCSDVTRTAVHTQHCSLLRYEFHHRILRKKQLSNSMTSRHYSPK
jgi:hypothetical protein